MPTITEGARYTTALSSDHISCKLAESPLLNLHWDIRRPIRERHRTCLLATLDLGWTGKPESAPRPANIKVPIKTVFYNPGPVLALITPLFRAHVLSDRCFGAVNVERGFPRVMTGHRQSSPSCARDGTRCRICGAVR
ncbi:hypothetical protein H4582DRAFT_2055947 [Lactarius indigo]|nr:hypothetical protein H4582DRAFT_2055947 [Lactarius indigo]